MQITKAMLEEENKHLSQQVLELIRKVDALKSTNKILAEVARRPDTALISAQRIAEASATLVDNANQLLEKAARLR